MSTDFTTESSIYLAIFEEKIFLTLANQKKELFLAAMFIGQMERNGETL
jgi:hypothetical protein